MNRVMNWQGLDLMTMDSGVDPFGASIVGAPHQIRGTDPAPYGRATLDYWQQNAPAVASDVNATTGSLASAAAGVASGAGASLWDKVKSGVFGGLLGVVVVALGLALILWGKD